MTGEAAGFGWPLLLYMGGAFAVVVGMLALSYVLGQRHRAKATDEPYESGMLTTGSARLRFSAKYYPMAMFFVIFDLEVVFVVAWAVAARELGWPGYIGMVVFVGLLLLVLAYLWREGALDWGSKKRLEDSRRA